MLVVDGGHIGHSHIFACLAVEQGRTSAGSAPWFTDRAVVVVRSQHRVIVVAEGALACTLAVGHIQIVAEVALGTECGIN